MEELANNVGGGNNAEYDGAQDLLPPGQQEHWVLLPAPTATDITAAIVATPLDEADSRVAFLAQPLAVGEVVAVVCRDGHRHVQQDQTGYQTGNIFL